MEVLQFEDADETDQPNECEMTTKYIKPTESVACGRADVDIANTAYPLCGETHCEVPSIIPCIFSAFSFLQSMRMAIDGVTCDDMETIKKDLIIVSVNGKKTEEYIKHKKSKNM